MSYQHGKNTSGSPVDYEKKKSIVVSHVEGLNDPTKTNKDICSGEPLGLKGSSNQKANNHDDNFR